MPDVLVVGSGAREHALVWKLHFSRQVRDVFVAPGNAGTALMARNLEIPTTDVDALVDAAKRNAVGLVVIGPEVPLVAGLADKCRDEGIRVFGPTAGAARIEGSKAYAKTLMRRCNVPTADFRVFDDFASARDHVVAANRPLVVKADGLAAGKGVFVCDGVEDASQALEACLVKGAFGPAGARVVVEERISGPEVSFMAFVSDETVVPMVPACDYKRLGDGDHGPNTGGMGAYSPPPWFDAALQAQVTETVLRPIARGLKADGHAFRGVLYAGLMLTPDGPQVLEFNCRFGDPETQVVLPRLESDLYEVLSGVANGALHDVEVRWSSRPAVGVVLASAGYPGQYATGFGIRGLDSLDEGVMVFHAGTRLGRVPGWDPKPATGWFKSRKMVEADSFTGGIETDGGRVLTVVALGEDIAAARDAVYRNLPRIQFDNACYRSDIALREVDPDAAARLAGPAAVAPEALQPVDPAEPGD